MVSTDSDRIAAAAEAYQGVQIYHREEELAGDRVTVLDALLDMMTKTERHDVFAYFLPTCPFRNAQDICKGVGLLQKGFDSVVSVAAYTEPPQLAMILDQDTGKAHPVFDNLTSGVTNSKYLRSYVKPNGGFYMAWWDFLESSRNFFSGQTGAVLMPHDRCVDIDHRTDILHAEALLNPEALKTQISR